jgi:hypothetical protein
MEGNGASDFNVEAGTGQVGTQLPVLLLIGLAFGRLRVLSGRKAGEGTHRVPAYLGPTYLHSAQAWA